MVRFRIDLTLTPIIFGVLARVYPGVQCRLGSCSIAKKTAKLVYYIRVMFTQTEAPPQVTSAQVYPDIYLSQTMPKSTSQSNIVESDLPQLAPLTPSYERGKLVFLQNCAHCHGLAGDGTGWDGLYLNPSPANLHDQNLSGLSDGELFAKVSFGIKIALCLHGVNGCQKISDGM